MSAFFYHANGRWHVICSLRELEAAAKFTTFHVAEPRVDPAGAEYLSDRLSAALGSGGTVKILLDGPVPDLAVGQYPLGRAPAVIRERITAALSIFGPVSLDRIEVIV